MPTFKYLVLKHHIKSDKTVRLKILVTHNREKRYLDSGIVAEVSDLIRSVKTNPVTNKKTESYKVRTQRYKDELDEIIKRYRLKCNETPERLKRMSIDEVVELIKLEDEKKKSINFIEFGTRHVEELKKQGRTGTASGYLTALNALERFVGSNYLPVENITSAFLQNFMEYIEKTPINAKTVRVSTQSRAPSLYLSNIRALYKLIKAAYNDEDRGIIRIPYNPFAKFKVPKPPKTKKRTITKEQVVKIFELSDEAVKNSSGSSRYNIAKDCFALSFGLMGMNSADLFSCKDYRDDIITYMRKKTTRRRDDDALMKVKVQPEIKPYLDKYRDKTKKRVFNFYQHYADDKTFNQSINKGLKVIGKIIGVDNLEFYAARHSWATIAINKAGVDKYTVHTALNHVDEEMRITEIYIEKDFTMINKANRKVLNYCFKKPKKAKKTKTS